MGVLDSFSLKGRVALVTGGAGKYGRQIFEALAEAGADTIIASRNMENLEAEAARFDNVTAMQLDLSCEESVRRLVGEIIERFGKIDILVNNAVTRSACKKWDQPMDVFDESLRTNVSSLFLLTFLAAEDMKKRNAGSIINVASYMGMRGLNFTNYEGTDMYAGPDWPSPIYAFEKGGMINFTRFAATVLGPHGIRINCISPGGFQSGTQETRFIKNYNKNTPLGRLAHSEDLKGVIVFLASDASGYITGTNLPVDGGYTAK